MIFKNVQPELASSNASTVSGVDTVRKYEIMTDEHEGGDVLRRTTDYPFTAHGAGMGAGQVPATGELPCTTEEVIFLEPGEERAQNIVKAMSNQYAGEVVQLLSQGGPLRLSDIADKMNISLNAAKYHVENLMAAGILEISETRYSVKGKKVKIYHLKNQVFIVAPRMNSIAELRSALMKYGAALALFPCVFFAVLLQPFFILPAVPLQLSGSIHPGDSIPAAVAIDNGIVSSLIFAAVATLLVLVAYELMAQYRKRKATD